tara:strand:+ start:596 stop:1387 length:792 start_codon:yes stop_codon:yes gene_type:complete
MKFKINRAVKLIESINIQLNKKFLNISKNNKTYKTKKDFQIDPVTKLDLDTEFFIRKRISKEFPGHSIIGEEYRDKKEKSEFTWYLDPIDGTKSFIMNLPNWSNLIGLYYKNQCVLSYANFPILKKYYLAFKKNTYVYANNKRKKILCNKFASVSNAKLTINTLHSLRNKKVKKFIMNFKGFFKVTGVDALNFCSIAEGSYDILIESGLKIVDIYPIKLIVENSGAIITDWQGNQRFSNGEVLVTPNRKIHNYYLKIINSKIL